MPLKDLFHWAKPKQKSTDDPDRMIAAAAAQGKPLTPREIAELHAKLHPETHKDYTWTPKEVLRDPSQPRPDLSRTYREIAEALAIHGNTQVKSPLFSRLPREVRLQIWEYAMGGRRVVLRVENSSRLKNAHWHHGQRFSRLNKLLNVVLLSRAAYVEAISILYSANIFCVGFGADANYQPLTLLYNLLPPMHIDHIQHVELGWHTCYGTSQYYDSHPQAWDLSLLAAEPVQITSRLWGDVGQVLAELKGLQTLRVIVWPSGDRRNALTEYDEEFLAPLESLKKIRNLRVTLSWGKQGMVVWQKGGSYIARRYRMDTMHEVNVPSDFDAAEFQN